MNGRTLTADLARALGLPKNTLRAVLTLDAGKLPLLEVTMHPTDEAGRPIVEEAPGAHEEGVALRIEKVRFVLHREVQSAPNSLTKRAARLAANGVRNCLLRLRLSEWFGLVPERKESDER